MNAVDPADSADPAVLPPRRRGWWRWVKRALVALILLLMVLVIFHRPLAHWAIRHFGTQFAEKAGWEAGWKSSGSIFGNVVFDEVRLAGSAPSVVRSITVDHAALEYDLWRLRGGGVGTVVEKVVLRRVEADIDLTGSTPTPEPASKASGKTFGPLPAVRVPIIEIEHLSLRLWQRNGVVEIVDFSLTIDPSRPGKISVVRFSAPGMPALVNAAGSTRATADSVTLENVALWPDAALDRLMLQLADLTAGKIGVEVAARQASATAVVQGTVNLSGPMGLAVEAQADVRRVTHETLAFWGVPNGGLGWDGGDIALRASAPVLRPDALVADVNVRGALLVRPGLPTATVEAVASLKDGTFKLTDGRVAAGSGTAVVRGTAAVPSTWAAVASATGQAAIEFEAPGLEEWMPQPAVVRGRATGRAEVKFSQQALTSATATVDGAGVVIQGLPVERVTTVVTTTDGGTLELKAEARLNATNTLEATGRLALRGEQAFDFAWKADCRDLATVPVEARAALPWPTAGTLLSSGSTAGTLAAVRAREWATLTGGAEVDARSVKIKGAALDSLRLRAQASAGEVTVDDLTVRFDAENTMTATGQASVIDRDAPVVADIRLALPAVARLSGWSTAFGGPALRGGAATIEWAARREPGGPPLGGSGSAMVRGLKIDGMPEVFGLEAAITQAGSSVRLTKLTATAGPWRAEGSAAWDGARVEVPTMTAWLKDQRVATVTAMVPVVTQRSPTAPGPLALDERVALSVAVEALDVDRLGAALGQALPVRGRVSANASLSGTLRTLDGNFSAQISELRPAGKDVAKLDPASVALKGALVGGQLTVEARALQRPLEPLTLEARAPIDAAALLQQPAMLRDIPLSGRLRLAESSLAFLPGWVPALKSVQGKASLQATVAGTLGRPQWQATAAVTIPEARLAGAALPSIKDVVVKLRTDEKRITVQEASVMLAGGRLSLLGGADLAQLQDPLLDLRLRADEVLVVRDDNLSLRANADIVCRGPVSRAAVSGTIDFVRGRVFKEIEFLPLSLPNQLPPPPPPTTLARSGPPALPSPFNGWTIDLAIKTRDPVRLMGNVARGNVVADLRLAGTGARPVLTGRATMEQMWLKLPFSRLNITEGAVVFTEDKPFDPQINVVGESITDGRVVEVSVQGRALDPKVRLTSSPPLPEGEIATLLATGVTTSDLTTRGDEAAGRAAFVVVQQAYRKMFRQTARRNDDAEPPRLSFEFALFGSDPSRRSLSAVYELNPQWRVIGRVGEAGTFRGMLHYLIRFR